MKTQFNLFLFSIAVLCTAALGEQMNTMWTGVYDLGELEFCTGLIAIGDHLLLSGHSQPPDYATGNIAVLCLSTAGDSLWTRFYGSDGLQYSDVICNCGSGFVVAGYSQAIGESNREAMMVRCDSEGDTIWTRYYRSDTASYHVLGAIELANQDVLILGYELHDTTAQYGWMCRMSPAGDFVWTKSFRQRGWDTFVDAVELPDGSLLVGGTAQEPPMYNYWTADMQLVHFSSNGDSLESHLYGGDRRERFYSLDRFGDNSVIATGYNNSVGDEMGDAYLVCANLSGGYLWSRTYGDMGMDHVHDGIALHDGTIFMSGHTETMGGSQGGGDFYSIRTDAEGNELETGFFGGSGWENSESVVAVGNYVFSAGYTGSFSATYDYCITAYAFEPLSDVNRHVTIAQDFDLSAYPNPFNASATILFKMPGTGRATVQAFDLNGRLVSTLTSGVLAAGRQSVVFAGDNLASGSYIVRVMSEGLSESQKLVLLK